MTDDFLTWDVPQREKYASLIDSLKFLDLTHLELAKRIASLGDNRDGRQFDDFRDICSGVKETPIELLFVLELLRRQLRRVKRVYAAVQWISDDEGKTIRAFADDCDIRLMRMKADNYLVDVTHRSRGYSPSWPNWTRPVERAKVLALLALDDCLSYVDANPNI